MNFILILILLLICLIFFKKNKSFFILIIVGLGFYYFFMEDTIISMNQISSGTLTPIRQTGPNIYADFGVHADLADF